jgi:phosphoribosylanthranilate isomerase
MARRVLVKVCGITSVEDGLMAARAGADALGLVFWARSPRAVTLEQARGIAGALPPFVVRVGVFVDAAPAEVARAAEAVGLDVLQLHGDEAVEACRAAPRRVIKAVRVGPGFQPEAAVRYRDAVAGLLLDTRDDRGLPGGTGRRFDWSVACALRAELPFLGLAGGLDPGNVAGAIRETDPDLVDVSSGVESAPGRKDEAKVRAFVEAVRSTRR